MERSTWQKLADFFGTQTKNQTRTDTLTENGYIDTVMDANTDLAMDTETDRFQ
jgi:hypothetical protein